MNKIFTKLSNIRVGIPKTISSCLLSICGYILFFKILFFLIMYFKEHFFGSNISLIASNIELKQICLATAKYITDEVYIIFVIFVLMITFFIELVLSKINFSKIKIQESLILNILYYLGFILLIVLSQIIPTIID